VSTDPRRDAAHALACAVRDAATARADIHYAEKLLESARRRLALAEKAQASCQAKIDELGQKR